MFDSEKVYRISFARWGMKAFAIATFCAATVVAAPQSEASTAAEKYVSRVSNGVLSAANSGSVNKFRSILRKHADLRMIAKFSLGRYARRLPSNQRRKFQRVVERMITKAFATYSNRLRGKRVDVTSTTNSGKHGIVVSTKIVGGSGGQVKWRIVKRSGGFRVVDVNVFGVWVSQRLRSVIVAKLKQRGGNYSAAFASLQ